MKNLKFNKGLLIGFALIILGAVTTTIIGGYNIMEVNNQYVYVLNYPHVRSRILSEIEVNMMNARRSMNRASMYANDFDEYGNIRQHEIDDQANYVDNLQQESESFFRQLRDSLIADPIMDSADIYIKMYRVDALETAIIRYFGYIDDTIAAARIGDTNETIRIVRAGMTTVEEAYKHFDYLKQITTEYMYEISADLTGIAQNTMFILTIVAVIGVTVIVLLVAYVHKLTTVTLKQENKQMKFMFDNMPVVVTIIDHDFNIIDCNDEVIKRFGISDKREYLNDFFAFSPEYQEDGTSSAEKSRKLIEEAFKAGTTEFDWLHQNKNGNLIPVEVYGLITRYNDSDVLVAYAIDTTRIKEAQAKEREASSRMKLMFDAAPLLIELWNKNNEITDCNLFAASHLNIRSANEYIDRMQEFFPQMQPDGASSWEYWVQNLQKVFEEGYHTFEVNIVRVDNGLPCILETIGILTEINGEPMAIMYSTDITQARQSRREAEEASERTNLMYSVAPLLIEFWNEDMELIDCNLFSARIFGLQSKEEYISKFYEYNPPTQPDGISSWEYWTDKIKSAFKYGSCAFDMVLKNKDGNAIYTEVLGMSVEINGKPTVITYSSDVTLAKENMEHQKKMIIAEENNQAKTRFLANMSHEIRTPLTAVLGISEIQLQNQHLDMEVEEAFLKINDSASILLQIINDILDISKIEAGKMDLKIARYEVASLVTDTVQLHLVFLGSKSIRFEVEADENMPAHLLGDDLRLKQIVNNLLSNAFKYTREGKVTFAMCCEYLNDERSDNASVNLIMKVTDTGKGMTKQQLKAIRDDYARFHEESDRFVPGTGLGMPIVYNMVSLMEGTIDIESEVGVGTTVRLRIPQIISGTDKLGPETVESFRHFEEGILANRRKVGFEPEPMPYGSVLIVDDVDTNLYVARGILKFYDLNIETVNSGFKAVENIKQGMTYDIIFMDHMMPDLDGMETTKLIRELGYNAPIVALTDNALIGQAEEFMKNGFDAFLSKPIQTVRLNSILIKFIRDKQPIEVLEKVRAQAKENTAQGSSAAIGEFLNNPDLLLTAYKDFARSQSNVMSEMFRAVQANDIKTAHRLAHTLKGLAAIIKEKNLVKLARMAEDSFRAGNVPMEIDELNLELEKVLAKIEIYLREIPVSKNTVSAADLDKTAVGALFDKAAELLVTKRGAVINMTDELAAIPQTEGLIALIEDLAFEAALERLSKLRKDLEV
ncbi:MAG: ATP-binding protein [Oscillospiraceae bacterium]|nr:ATP-binding protein [Oscillospiraceae bacterium]